VQSSPALAAPLAFVYFAIPVVEIDRQSPEPVIRQIARQIRETIASGQLPAGAALPSVRTLASDLEVNLNTVARAYRLLQDEGFVTIHGRSRVEVRPPAKAADAEARNALIAPLREALARLRQAGVSASQLRRLAQREIDALV
jgi:DNA-binding transcriptional regulator YhcF (GntR family)